MIITMQLVVTTDNYGDNIMDKIANKKYLDHRYNAKKRGVAFLLTKTQWWDIWQKSGHWEQRGHKQGQYVMSRYGDQGPYEENNVFIQLHENNIKQAMIGNMHSIGAIRSKDTRQAISQTMTGFKRTQIMCPHCSKVGGNSQMKRYHMDNCKAINIK